MRWTAIPLLGIWASLYPVAGEAQDTSDIIESTFRPAIVKIDVSTNKRRQ